MTTQGDAYNETDEALLRRLQALGLFEPIDPLDSSAPWKPTELMEAVEDMAARGDCYANHFMETLDTEGVRMLEIHRHAMELARRYALPWKGSEQPPPDPPSPIEFAILRLARAGLIEFGLAFRNGQPVWVQTELGKALTELEATDDPAALEYKRIGSRVDEPLMRDEVVRLGMTLARRLGVPWKGVQPSHASS